MAIRAKLKFKGDMPYSIEHKLLTKLGFRVQARSGAEWMIVEKVKPSNFKPEVLINGDLHESIVNMLNKRCMTIVDHWDEPELHIPMIKIRLHNMAQTLPPMQRKYVEEWTERNVTEEI